MSDATEPSPGLLRQMIDQNHQVSEEGHERLRKDYRALILDVAQIKKDLDEIRAQGRRAEDRAKNIDASKLRLSLRDAIIVGMAVVGIASGMWLSTSGMRSDIRDILTHMADQVKIDEQKAKLQDERDSQIRDSIEAMKRRQELQQYEIQGLKEAILKGHRP